MIYGADFHFGVRNNILKDVVGTSVACFATRSRKSKNLVLADNFISITRMVIVISLETNQFSHRSIMVLTQEQS